MRSEKIFRLMLTSFIGMLIMSGGSTVNAEVKPFTGIGKYIMSDFDSQSIAKERAKVRAEKNAKDKAGVYLTSFARAENSKLTQQEIFAITNNITNIVGEVDYAQEILPVDDDKVIRYIATLTANIDTDGINDWLKRDDKNKVTIIEQNETTGKVADENDKQFDALKTQYDNATNQQDKDRIKTEIEQVDKEFSAIQKLEEGNRFYYNGDYDNAINAYTQAIAINPNLAEAYLYRGDVYNLLKNEYDKAIEDYNRAITINPENAEAYKNRGWAYDFKGGVTEKFNENHRQAIEDFTRAINLQPDYAGAYAWRGFTYCKQGDEQKAFADFDSAIKINPENFLPYNLLDITYGLNENFVGKVIDYLTKIIGANPQNSQAYFHRGKAYFKRGELDNAIADYDKSIELNPDNAEVYGNRGLALYGKGDLSGAIESFTQGINLAPKDPRTLLVYINRANAYVGKGDYENAFADFDSVIALDSQNTWAYYNRGLAYKIKGDTDKAVADFKKILEINPNDMLAKIELQNLGEG